MKKKWQVWNNQKGLTLIEVLAVIVILGIIAAIAVPNIANILDKSETNADEQTEKIIEDAALLYLINEDAPEFVEGSDKILAVQTLVDKGYLKEVPKNQKNNLDYETVIAEYEEGWTVSVVPPAPTAD